MPDLDPFPWHLATYDAHCHPTDTMSITPSIPDMKTRILTVMATRSQDQHLVSSLADTYGVKSSSPSNWAREERVIPCFGWHPWFAHQMYIPSSSEDTESRNGTLHDEQKVDHYKQVFKKPNPSASDRQVFLALPSPTPVSSFLAQTRARLLEYPFALVGEIGLDRSIRIPVPESLECKAPKDEDVTPGGRQGRKLTPFKTDLAHQKRIFGLQMQLAGEMGRAVSIHGVQAHGMLFEAISDLWKGHEKTVPSKRERKKMAQAQAQQQSSHQDQEQEDWNRGGDGESTAKQHIEGTGGRIAKPYPPRICLHSYSGNFSNLTRYLSPSIPVRIFVSFSTAVNLSDLDPEDPTPGPFQELIMKIPDHMLLVESDLHTAGEEMDKRMENIVRRICMVKGWGLEEGVSKLGANWRAFVFGKEGEEKESE